MKCQITIVLIIGGDGLNAGDTQHPWIKVWCTLNLHLPSEQHIADISGPVFLLICSPIQYIPVVHYLMLRQMGKALKMQPDTSLAMDKPHLHIYNLGWALQHQVCDPNLYHLFLCCFWSIIWENIWFYRFWIDFEVSVIFFGSQCKIQGKIDAQIYFGHNFWQEGPTDLRSTPLSYIFHALFRDTPHGHVYRA